MCFKAVFFYVSIEQVAKAKPEFSINFFRGGDKKLFQYLKRSLNREVVVEDEVITI